MRCNENDTVYHNRFHHYITVTARIVLLTINIVIHDDENGHPHGHTTVGSGVEREGLSTLEDAGTAGGQVPNTYFVKPVNDRICDYNDV